ncbi:MAG: DNA mismatch endonuclease Vsr [SAR202 cluster bacterium]|nr:DNA mismatch endonuclease Vsr [SAR202 cluster bacterium]
MSDPFSMLERSRIMAQVHSKDTAPEVRVRRALHSAGFRFRVHAESLPGKPDIVLPRFHTAIFVNGCLWHGHHCKRFRMPVAHSEYWERKISRNQARDAANIAELKAAGWQVFTIWECELPIATAAVISKLQQMRLPPDCQTSIVS